MHKKIKTFDETCKVIRKYHKRDEKVVFCHGYFDILHKGHLNLFWEAKKYGNILVVGVDTKKNAEILRRKRRLLNSNEDRVFIISNLLPVDYCFIIPSMTNSEPHSKDKPEFYIHIYKKLKPNIIVSCSAIDKEGGLNRRRQAKLSKIKFVSIAPKNISTTKIITTLGLK